MKYQDRLQYAQGVYAAGVEKVRYTPQPKGQKFPVGSLVRIKGGAWRVGLRAKVEFTYAHAFWGDNVRDYSLLVEVKDGKWSSCAWFDESILEEIV